MVPLPGCAGRSIPAWAGKPAESGDAIFCAAVYPRVGGETRKKRERQETMSGLSPRGRGNRLDHLKRDEPPGSIPAWAGKPEASDRVWMHGGVYPRVGGETVKERIGVKPR